MIDLIALLPVKSDQKRAERELWMAEYGVKLGAVLGLVLCLVLGGLAFWLMKPTGASQSLKGVVSGIQSFDTDEGAASYALIRLDNGSTARVRLPRASRCVAGERLDVLATPAAAGPLYSLPDDDCPARRP